MNQTENDNNTQEARSLHEVDMPAEGQALSRPTAAGWWWGRRISDVYTSEWYAIQVFGVDGELWMEDGDGSPMPVQHWPMAGRSEWVGPLVPPGGHISKHSDGANVD